MSYARWGHDSDLYIFEDEYGMLNVEVSASADSVFAGCKLFVSRQGVMPYQALMHLLRCLIANNVRAEPDLADRLKHWLEDQ